MMIAMITYRHLVARVVYERDFCLLTVERDGDGLLAVLVVCSGRVGV